MCIAQLPFVNLINVEIWYYNNNHILNSKSIYDSCIAYNMEHSPTIRDGLSLVISSHRSLTCVNTDAGLCVLNIPAKQSFKL